MLEDHTFFFLGIALILMHEMDAIRCKEWRIFPGLSFLDDKLGFIIFMFAHIPLFFLVIREIARPENDAFIQGFSYFLIIHLGLHLLFLMHKKNEFKDWISWSIIGGAGICGLFEILST